MESKRRYSEKEISDILKLAAQRQEIAREDNPAAGQGMTLAEIKEIATQVGIDPRHVQDAAETIDRGEVNDNRFHVWGAPITFEFERAVEGEFTEEKWTAMVEEIRKRLGFIGQVNQVGTSFEWSGGDVDLTHVTATPRSGQTRIRVSGKFGGAATLIHLLGDMFGFFVAIAALTLPVGPAISAAILGGTLGSTRYGFAAYARKKESKLKDLIQRLESIVSEPIAQTSAQRQSVIEKHTQEIQLEDQASQSPPSQTIRQ